MEKNMLKSEDKIFKNLYNDLGWEIDSALKRNDWKDTKNIISKGRVIFNKSSPNEEPCGIYFVETDYKDLLIINCEDNATIEIR